MKKIWVPLKCPCGKLLAEKEGTPNGLRLFCIRCKRKWEVVRGHLQPG